MIAEIEKAIEDSKKVQTERDKQNFFRKDLSQMMKLNGKLVYAVDVSSPEMNEVEMAFHNRDEKF